MKKMIITGLAAIGVAGMIGGGTFANWSDFQTYGNAAGADHLTLDVDSSSTIGFEQIKMAPGVNREFDFVVASRQGDAVPDASLTVSFEDAFGTEDGCRGNSEAVVDADCDSANDGEFIDEAYISINASAPTTDLAGACALPRGGRLSTMSLRDAFSSGAIDLLDGVTLKPGEGICVGMGITLPSDEHPSLPEATNASQGDYATWDFVYDLVQASTGPGTY